MLTTRVLRSHSPLIHFLGKRTIPESIDHSPRPHPASPTHSLPTTFKQYRESIANQHGPLAQQRNNGSQAQFSSSAGSSSSSAPKPAPRKFSAKLKEGEFFDRSELPQRFWRMPWSADEIAAVESGGASVW